MDEWYTGWTKRRYEFRKAIKHRILRFIVYIPLSTCDSRHFSHIIGSLQRFSRGYVFEHRLVSYLVPTQCHTRSLLVGGSPSSLKMRNPSNRGSLTFSLHRRIKPGIVDWRIAKLIRFTKLSQCPLAVNGLLFPILCKALPDLQPLLWQLALLPQGWIACCFSPPTYH